MICWIKGNDQSHSSLKIALGQALCQLSFFLDECGEITCALALVLTSSRVYLFAKSVDLKSNLLLLLIPRHSLSLCGRELGHVDSTPADVGVGPHVGEVRSSGGDDVRVLEHVHWLEWCVWVVLWCDLGLGDLRLLGSLLERL